MDEADILAGEIFTSIFEGKGYGAKWEVDIEMLILLGSPADHPRSNNLLREPIALSI